MYNEELSQSSDKNLKVSPTRIINYPKQKIPRYLKQMIDVNNTIQATAESMYELASAIVSEELKKY